jgi:hypothetical protein
MARDKFARVDIFIEAKATRYAWGRVDDLGFVGGVCRLGKK